MRIAAFRFMSPILLAVINFILFLSLSFFLADAIAQARWRAKGNAAVVLLIVLCGQVWLIPQAVNFFLFHHDRLLYPLWFGNWIASAVAVVFFSLALRYSSRDLLDAARLDGAGVLAIHGKVIWPVVRPALLALAVILLMATWAEFAHPLFAATGSVPTPAFGDCTVPTAPRELALLLGVSVAATVPVIALYFFASRSGRSAPARAI